MLIEVQLNYIGVIQLQQKEKRMSSNRHSQKSIQFVLRQLQQQQPKIQRLPFSKNTKASENLLLSSTSMKQDNRKSQFLNRIYPLLGVQLSQQLERQVSQATSNFKQKTDDIRKDIGITKKEIERNRQNLKQVVQPIIAKQIRIHLKELIKQQIRGLKHAELSQKRSLEKNQIMEMTGKQCEAVESLHKKFRSLFSKTEDINEWMRKVDSKIAKTQQRMQEQKSQISTHRIKYAQMLENCQRNSAKLEGRVNKLEQRLRNKSL